MTTTPLSQEDLKAEIVSLSDAELALVRADIQKRLDDSEFASSSVRRVTRETATEYLTAINKEINRRETT